MADDMKGMRRNLTRYGDAGFSLYLRTAFIKAMGYSDDALSRPVIGVVNTFSEFNACHAKVPVSSITTMIVTTKASAT